MEVFSKNSSGRNFPQILFPIVHDKPNYVVCFWTAKNLTNHLLEYYGEVVFTIFFQYIRCQYYAGMCLLLGVFQLAFLVEVGKKSYLKCCLSLHRFCVCGSGSCTFLDFGTVGNLIWCDCTLGPWFVVCTFCMPCCWTQGLSRPGANEQTLFVLNCQWTVTFLMLWSQSN